MKYAKAILVTIAVGVLLDILIDVTIPDRVMNVVFVVVASLVLFGLLLVSVGTVRRNRWGINFEPLNCPAAVLRCRKCGNRNPGGKRSGVTGPARSVAAKWTNGVA